MPGRGADGLSRCLLLARRPRPSLDRDIRNSTRHLPPLHKILNLPVTFSDTLYGSPVPVALRLPPPRRANSARDQPLITTMSFVQHIAEP